MKLIVTAAEMLVVAERGVGDFFSKNVKLISISPFVFPKDVESDGPLEQGYAIEFNPIESKE